MLKSELYLSEIKSYVVENKNIFEALKDKKILITGGAGCIGSYLIDLLSTVNDILGCNVKIICVEKNKQFAAKRFKSQNIELIYADVNDETIPDFDVDYIIHAASNTSPLDYATKPISTVRTNIIGTDKMLQYALKNNAKRFMFCSSVETYGMNNGDVDDFKEDYSGYVNSNTLRAGYPSAKRASEALCNAYYSEYPSLSFVIARIGRVYGPTIIKGDTKAPSQFINNAVNSEDIVMKSNGKQIYSFCYVGDCAMALLYILAFGKDCEAYNVADPKAKIMLKDFAEYSARSGGTKVVYQAPSDVEKAGYSKITKASMDTSKLETLGWKSKYGPKEGIERTVQILKEIN